MFNSIAFDVVLGMVFVFLLYSLLISILTEIASNRLQLRERVLKKGIERMLNDGLSNRPLQNESTFGKYKRIIRHFLPLGNFLLKRDVTYKYSLAWRFYNQPTIKYMSEGQRTGLLSSSHSIPAYISADNFASTIIALFANKGTGQKDFDKITFCLQFNTLHIEPETLTLFRNFHSSSNNDVNQFKFILKQWFNDTMDRSTGWYKRRLRVIQFILGLFIAIAFNLDSFEIAKLLSRDKDARGQLVNMAVAYAKDTAKQGLAKGVSASDSIATKTLLDSAANQVSRDVFDANKILGLGWDFTSIQREDSCLYYNIDTSLMKYLKDTLIQNIFHSDTQITKLQHRLSYLLTNQEKNSVTRMIAQNTALINTDMTFLDNLVGKKFIKVSTKSHFKPKKTGSDTLVIKGAVGPTICEEIGFVLRQIWPPHLNFWGWMVTAIMLSLGAPFWFGLLKNLASLRSTGVKPEDKLSLDLSDDSNNRAPVPVNPPQMQQNLNAVIPALVQQSPSDFIDAAIKTFGPSIKAIPGVQGIFRGKNAGNACVQINVLDAVTQNAINANFPVLTVGTTNLVPMIVVTGAAKPHGRIVNASGYNEFGSLGCVLQNTLDKTLHILSCWHVLKGDLNYDKSDPYTTINDVTGNGIATRWMGGINGSVDMGIAQLIGPVTLDNTSLQKQNGFLEKIKYRPVTSVDVNSQIQIQYYDWINNQLKIGFIYTDGDVTVNYLDKKRTVNDVLILTSNLNTNSSITQGGNSGSIIFDTGGNAIGMIVAGDANYSYAVKLSNVFNIADEMKIY